MQASRSIRNHMVLFLLSLLLGMVPAHSSAQQDGFGRATSADEAQIRSIILKFYNIYIAARSPQAVNDHMELWSAKSPDLEAHSTTIRTLVSYDTMTTSVSHLVLSQLSVRGDQASVKLSYDFTVTMKETPAASTQHLIKRMTFAREGGGWKIWQYSNLTNELVDCWWAARTPSERREALAQADPDLRNHHLVETLLLKGANSLSARPEKEAVAVYEGILEAAQQIGDRPGQVDTLERIAELYASNFHYQDALRANLRRVDAARASGSKNEIGMAQLDLGNTYVELKSYSQASQAYDRALAAFTTSPPFPRGIGAVWLQKGTLLHVQKKDDLALTCFDRALKVDDPLSGMGAWQGKGQICQSRGDYAGALRLYNQAISLPDSIIGIEVGKALLYNDIATVYFFQGDYDKASSNYAESLKRQRALRDTAGIAIALLNLGNTRKVAGDFQQALSYYTDCIRLNYARAASAALNNMGAVLEAQGKYQEAIDCFKKYLTYCRAEGDKSGAAAALNNMGIIYHTQGMDEEALRCFQQCIEGGAKPEIALGDAGIGTVYDVRKDYSKAALWYGRAQKLFHAIGDIPREAQMDGFFALLHYHEQGDSSTPDYRQAIHSAQLSLDESQRMGDQEGVGCAKLYLAEISLAQRDYKSARQRFKEVADAAARTGMTKLLVASAWGLGRAYKEEGHYEDAISPLQTAVTQLSFLRDNVFGNELNREAYLATNSRSQIYETLAWCQAKCGDQRGALATIELSKSKQVTDKLRIDALNSSDPALRSLIAQIGDLELKLTMLRRTLENETRKSSDRQNKLLIQNLTRYVTTTLQEYYSASNQISQANGDYAQYLKLAPDSLEAIQKDLPEHAVAIEYLPLETAMVTFVVTRLDIHVVYVPVGRARLTQLIDGFYGELARARRQPRARWDWEAPAAQTLRVILTRLYDCLIAPVSVYVDGADPLLIVPSGVLFRLPFETLAREMPDGSLGFLVQSKRIATLPSLKLWTRIASIHAPTSPAISHVAVFGDPDNTLPGARDEAARISSLFPGSLVFLGDQASGDRLRSLPPTVDCVVIATHATVNPQDVNSSYLSLARGERLTFERICRLVSHYPAWMTVLSACNSATGGNEPGNADASLAEGFVLAGSRTVIASHWEVSDSVTEQLMGVFFERLRNNPNGGAAAAKQYAQLKLLGDPTTAHPLYWAGFTLIGDWR